MRRSSADPRDPQHRVDVGMRCELRRNIVERRVDVGGIVAAVASHIDPREQRIAQPRRGEQSVEIRSEEHTSELKPLMRISYAVFCLKKKKNKKNKTLNQSRTP